MYSYTPCFLLTRKPELRLLVQKGLAVCSQGRGCDLWLGAGNALGIGLTYFFPVQSETRAKQICRSRLLFQLCVLISLLQHWTQAGLALTSCCLSLCFPTRAGLPQPTQNLDGLDPIFFLLNSFRHTFITHISVPMSLSSLADLRVDGSCYPVLLSKAVTCCLTVP